MPARFRVGAGKFREKPIASPSMQGIKPAKATPTRTDRISQFDQTSETGMVALPGSVKSEPVPSPGPPVITSWVAF